MPKAWSRCLVPLVLLLLSPALSMAEVEISVNFAPPELPVYDQPPIPEDGYIWTPGFWAWGDDMQDYYWVPGTWVPAPEPNYLWTPGYWAADGAVFFFHPGYWGPHVGYYGGVNYGYGYGGHGYEGGYWEGGHMYYNRSVNNINTTRVTNVYNRTVINNVTVTRVSYNGGSGGVRAQPTPTEQSAAHERHIAVTPVQREHLQIARTEPTLRASANQGRPPIAATPRAAAFSGPGVVRAVRGGEVHSAPNAPQARGNSEAAGATSPHQTPQPASRPASESRPPQRPTLEPARPAVQERQPVPEHQAVQERQPVPQHQAVQERPAWPQHQAVQERPPPAQPRPQVQQYQPVQERPAPVQRPQPAPERRAVQERPPVPEQHRAPEPAPRPAAPPPPRAEPRPQEHPPARDDRNHEPR